MIKANQIKRTHLTNWAQLAKNPKVSPFAIKKASNFRSGNRDTVVKYMWTKNNSFCNLN